VNTSHESVQVLEVDSGLGEGLTAEQLPAARRAVVASVKRLGTGSWHPNLDHVPQAGYLVLEGCIAREMVILGETAAIDFLAQGDLVRPSEDAGLASVASRVTWEVLEPMRLAVLDRDFLVAVQPWPEVIAQLLKRQERRAEWLANVLAVSHLPRVELRILVLFWQFADRWGSVRGGGVTVPIPLTHLNIARLVGARRPTVTSALNKLIGAGLLIHESNGHWILRGRPPTQLHDATGAVLPTAASPGRRVDRVDPFGSGT
jgi:CRP/FNR family cyclic AMP-dependent transcriptional regulator